jgi:hypothetical protein
MALPPPPKNIKRILAGHKAQKSGALFEIILHRNALVYGWQVTDIPDGCKQLRGKMIRVPTPFDYVFTKDCRAVFCDAKTIASGTFGASDITQHQVDELSKTRAGGFPSGYIVNFSKFDKTVWFPVQALITCLNTRVGLTPSSGILLGDGMKIKIDNIFSEP